MLIAGLSRSMQFTALNTLAFADVVVAQRSSAATLSSMLQQVAMLFGVAVAACDPQPVADRQGRADARSLRLPNRLSGNRRHRISWRPFRFLACHRPRAPRSQAIPRGIEVEIPVAIAGMNSHCALSSWDRHFAGGLVGAINCQKCGSFRVLRQLSPIDASTWQISSRTGPYHADSFDELVLSRLAFAFGWGVSDQAPPSRTKDTGL